MRYDKLVRDFVCDKIKANGERPRSHVASEEEFRLKLREKLIEEVGEFLSEENGEELVDILETVFAFADLLDINRIELEEMRKKKEIERGAFRKRIILEEVLKD